MGIRLTKRRIDALEAPAPGAHKARYAIHWDDEVRGFGLRITESDKRSFILQVRIKGRERRITIGRYPGVSPELAKRRARDLLGEVARGGDPVAERAREKLKGITLEEAFEEYIAQHNRKDGKPLKERTKRDMRRALIETFPDWKRRPLVGITRDMVKARYAERAKASIARTNVAMRYLRAVFNFAAASYRDSEGRPVLTDNPVRVLSESGRWKGVAPRARALSDAELAIWVPAVLALGETPERPAGQGKHKPKLRQGEVFRDLFLFLALTGARKSEAIELRKRDVDLEAGAVTFPDTKNRRDHTLPVSPYLRDLLKRRIEATSDECEHVFAGADGRPVTNLRYALARVAGDSGVKFSPHDLRRTAATALERAGVPVYTVKAVLNHLPGAGDVTGRYVRVDDEMKRRALDLLERAILRHVDGDAKVVALWAAGR